MFELTPTSSLSGSVVTVCLQSLKWRRQAVLYSPVLPGIPVTTVTTHYHTRRSNIQYSTSGSGVACLPRSVKYIWVAHFQLDAFLLHRNPSLIRNYNRGPLRSLTELLSPGISKFRVIQTISSASTVRSISALSSFLFIGCYTVE